MKQNSPNAINNAITTIGITTAIAIVPPDESLPPEPPCSPAAPSVEGVAEALVLEVFDDDDVSGVGVGSEAVEVMVTTVGASGDPFVEGVCVTIEVTTELGVVEATLLLTMLLLLLVGSTVVVEGVMKTEDVVKDVSEVDSLVEVIVSLPDVTVEVSVTTDCEVGVIVLVSVVSMTLVVSAPC